MMKMVLPIFFLLIISLLIPPLSKGDLTSQRLEGAGIANLDVCNMHTPYQHQSQRTIPENIFDISTFRVESHFPASEAYFYLDIITAPIELPPKA